MKTEIATYLAKIGRKGGRSGHGARKARSTAQARAAAQSRWTHDPPRSGDRP